MPPAAADFSHPISSSSQPVSQNPTPAYPGTNGACGDQSSCLNFADKVSNGGLSFDFSNRGSNFLGQSKPPRIRHSVKKMRGKICVSENKDFSNALRTSVDLNLGNEGSVIANSTGDDQCGGSLGKKAAGRGGVDSVQLGKLGKVGSVFGADGSTSGSNSKNENEGFALGTSNSCSTSSFSKVERNFVFGSSNYSSQLHFDNRAVVCEDEKSSSVSNSKHNNNTFVFGADKISSGANVSNKDVGSVFGDGESSTMKGNGASLVGADTNDTTSKPSLKIGDFVQGSNESYSSKVSNMRCTKSSPTVGHSGAHESNTFDNTGFVFGAKNHKLTSDSGLEQKSSNDNHCVQSGDHNTGFVSGSCKSDVKLDAREFFKWDGHSSFATSLGTEWNLDGREDHSRFSFGASKSDSMSQVGKSRTRRSSGKLNSVSQGEKGSAAGTDFRKADLNSGCKFGNSTEEKSRSTDGSDLRVQKNKLDGQKPENDSASVKGSSDAMRSSFKFVIGSSSSPGSAFYKVPLSKLLDDMKGLNIDNSKGVNGNDKAKVVGTDSLFGPDCMFSFKSNEQASGIKNQTLKSTEKNSRNVLNEGQPIHDNNVNKTSQTPAVSSAASSYVQQRGVGFDTRPDIEVENKGKFSFATIPRADACSKDFKCESFSFTSNLFSGLGGKLEFCANSRYTRDKRSKKTRGKLRQRVQAKHLDQQDQICKEGSSPKTFKSPGCYSPMDFSPYGDATESVQRSACNSVATEKKEENSLAGRQRSGNNECDEGPGEQDVSCSKIHQESKSKPSDQNGLSAIQRQCRKKYKLKVGNGLSGKTSVQKSDVLFSSAQFSSNAPNPFRIGEPQVKSGVASNSHRKNEGQYAKLPSSEDFMNEECDQWRMRGNQAYKIRDLSKADECYTNGINSAREKNVPEFYTKPLLLCYTNRAATRMSLGRLREALEDCKFAATLDPSFLKAKLRAANCHLVLGEFQEAVQYYNYCLESGNAVHLDRKVVIEAGEGIQKAQRASEYLCQAANLLQQTTSDAASSALDNIVKGLSISCYSERFLEMKGEALFLLRRYDEVINLCEQTFDIAEKNFSATQLANERDFEFKSSARPWRWCLMSKCQFHLGRLEVALDLIKRQQNSTSISDWCSSMDQESLIPLAATIRELLHRKKEGNEAFQSGKHLEAVEHYTAAISSSVDSRPFAAICFCNRAAGHQALGQLADAIADCSVAIALDGDYVKAVSRRATLHEMIRDYNQAISDLQKLISLLENQSQKNAQQSGKVEVSSGSDPKELKRAQRRLSLMEEKAKQGAPMDFYLILGIKASDAEAEIKKAYKKAALKHHPDKAGQNLARTDGGDDGRSWKDIVEKVHEDADRLFKIIGEAYAVLSDADKRSKYNFEEEIRNCRSEGKRHTDSGRSADYYSSPSYDKGRCPGRQPNFSSSSFERSRSRRYWQESWRTYDNSHSRW